MALLCFWAGQIWAGHLLWMDIKILVEVMFDREEFTTSLIEVVKVFGESGRINI